MRSARTISFGLLAAFVLTFALAAFVPAPTFACSCALITIGELDPTQNQVYVATAGEPIPDGTPMAVERWFAGPGAAPVVLLGASSFGDSAGCGTPQFAPGSRWIVSAWAGDPTQPPTTGLCQPHAPLDSPEGQAMLTQAAAAYGDGSTPEGGGGPSASPTAAPSAPAASGDATPMIAVGGVVLLGVLALGVVYVIGRSRSKAD
ncbi:MAG TPA: hypothetical protein VIF84_02890 [Candidatus Limnocylindrales bacterium]|jgi:hypothetical protein